MTSGHSQRRLLLNGHTRRPLFAATIALVGVSLFGCGDGGSDSASATNSQSPAPVSAPSQPSVVNHAPTISGTPQRAVVGGSAYAFAPAASDADGDILTFTITGRPAWAAFDRLTGRLSGTPNPSDVGSSAVVAISVTDGEKTAALASFTIQVVGTATGSASLTWVPPTENEDGTPLRDLAGYKLYWGTEEGKYTHSVTLMNAGLTRYVVEQLPPAKWHFVMTAITARGIESSYSNLAVEEVL